MQQSLGSAAGREGLHSLCLRVSLSASEFFAAGLSLPPSVRKDVALRLLESVEVVDDELAEQAWSAEMASRVDDIVSGRVRAIPHEEVLAHLAERRAARQAARHQA